MTFLTIVDNDRPGARAAVAGDSQCGDYPCQGDKSENSNSGNHCGSAA